MQEFLLLSDNAGVFAFVLTLAVVLVNGWTDAPNAIATVVITGGMTFPRAVLLAAVMNFAGTVVMTALNPVVAETVCNIAYFGSDADALTALSAGLAAIVVWACLAWRFGIPTSESHALIAGVSGSAFAVGGGINAGEWQKVLWGLAISVALGSLLGYVFSKIFKKYQSSGLFFKRAQIAAAGAAAFMHGAQDGQKFLGIMVLAVILSGGNAGESFFVPVSLVIVTAAVMAIGTLIGGGRIISSMGKMVSIKSHQGFAADSAASVGMLFTALFGMPVSTTHAKTTATLGAGLADSDTKVDLSIFKNMALTWMFTFPCCGVMGYFFAKVFMWVLQIN